MGQYEQEQIQQEEGTDAGNTLDAVGGTHVSVRTSKVCVQETELGRMREGIKDASGHHATLSIAFRHHDLTVRTGQAVRRTSASTRRRTGVRVSWHSPTTDKHVSNPSLPHTVPCQEKRTWHHLPDELDPATCATLIEHVRPLMPRAAPSRQHDLPQAPRRKRLMPQRERERHAHLARPFTRRRRPVVVGPALTLCARRTPAHRQRCDLELFECGREPPQLLDRQLLRGDFEAAQRGEGERERRRAVKHHVVFVQVLIDDECLERRAEDPESRLRELGEVPTLPELQVLERAAQGGENLRRCALVEEARGEGQ